MIYCCIIALYPPQRKGISRCISHAAEFFYTFFAQCAKIGEDRGGGKIYRIGRAIVQKNS